jgi:hypothetical protein
VRQRPVRRDVVATEAWEIADRLQSLAETDEGLKDGRHDYGVAEPHEAPDGIVSFDISWKAARFRVSVSQVDG